MFKDSTGAVSMMRVCMFLIVTVVLAVYVAQNIVSMYHHAGLVSFGVQEIAALGLVFAGKTVQNFTENAYAMTMQKSMGPSIESADKPS